MFVCKFEFFKKISKLGQYSLAFYLVHVLILRWITPFVAKIPAGDYSLYNICFIISYALTVSFGTLAISVGLSKIPYLNFLLFGDLRCFKRKNKKQQSVPITEKNVNDM